jgi:hypothetical protein
MDVNILWNFMDLIIVSNNAANPLYLRSLRDFLNLLTFLLKDDLIKNKIKEFIMKNPISNNKMDLKTWYLMLKKHIKKSTDIFKKESKISYLKAYANKFIQKQKQKQKNKKSVANQKIILTPNDQKILNLNKQRILLLATNKNNDKHKDIEEQTIIGLNKQKILNLYKQRLLKLSKESTITNKLLQNKKVYHNKQKKINKLTISKKVYHSKQKKFIIVNKKKIDKLIPKKKIDKLIPKKKIDKLIPKKKIDKLIPKKKIDRLIISEKVYHNKQKKFTIVNKKKIDKLIQKKTKIKNKLRVLNKFNKSAKYGIKMCVGCYN